MARQKNRTDGEKIDDVIDLMKFSIALQLAEAGVAQALIGKKLKIQKVRVNAMLKGVQFKGSK